MPAEILFPVISDLIDPATDQKGNAMAKPNYQFKKRQKELAKKKKKEEKRQRKLENKTVETDETEKARSLQWRTGKHMDRPAPIAGAIQWQ
jgi:hypothetical protein